MHLGRFILFMDSWIITNAEMHSLSLVALVCLVLINSMIFFVFLVVFYSHLASRCTPLFDLYQLSEGELCVSCIVCIEDRECIHTNHHAWFFFCCCCISVEYLDVINFFLLTKQESFKFKKKYIVFRHRKHFPIKCINSYWVSIICEEVKHSSKMYFDGFFLWTDVFHIICTVE